MALKVRLALGGGVALLAYILHEKKTRSRRLNPTLHREQSQQRASELPAWGGKTVREAFDAIDVDGDGHLDASELAHAWRAELAQTAPGGMRARERSLSAAGDAHSAKDEAALRRCVTSAAAR